MLGLLHTPENIRDLSLTTLQDGEATQEKGPGGLLFLSPIQQRFSNLTTLHLCKFAELSERHYEDMGLRWLFDQDNDRAILDEWKNLIPHVSATLQYLTLEDRYLVIGYNKPTVFISGVINPQAGEDGDPEDWSRASNDRFQQVLLPVLATQPWPAMKEVILIGLSPIDVGTRVDPLEHLRSSMVVEFHRGEFLEFCGEFTPISIEGTEFFPHSAV
ncbi:MAG: hypothetical protein L6R38_002097 [Xanthoria sp. 2 TBL-2021]|nr:MAG: hypothetical protein L6R38_002097 [Xanthoria sp. 2 TBL-2021]